MEQSLQCQGLVIFSVAAAECLRYGIATTGVLLRGESEEGARKEFSLEKSYLKHGSQVTITWIRIRNHNTNRSRHLAPSRRIVRLFRKF